MRTCPNDHPVAADLVYCEECGSRADLEPSLPPARVSPEQPQTWSCQSCGTDQSMSRFCEACGASNPGHPGYVAIDDADSAATPAPPNDTAPAPERTWTIVASADRTYFDQMQSHDGPDAGGLKFPSVYPPRTFTLDRTQVFIGRRSRNQGIDPDIDLSAAPEDSGVSHAHAALIATDDGWSVVDVGSANGTYLNGASEPIPVETPVALTTGDRIQLGAWTTLTLHAG
jgi:hypothetical protein